MAEAKKKIVKKKPVKKPVVEVAVKKPVKPAKKETAYIYQVGRRKRAVAQVRFYKKGEDKITINQMDYREYLKFPPYQDIMLAPLRLVGEDKGHQITILVRGGGIKAQAEAIRHGLSRALVIFNENYKKSIKGVGFLTRDSRKKERKKPGLKRARRAPQWQKR